MQNFIYLIQIISIILLVFFERKDPRCVLSWILVIFFIPGLGFFLYFFFGSTLKLKLERKYKKSLKLEKKYLESVKEEFLKIKNIELINEYADLVILNTKSTMGYYTENNYVKIFTNGNDAFCDVFKELKKAKESIDITFFIFNPKDKIGKEFLSILCKKAREGVRVRLIYDRFGNYKNKYKDFKCLLDAGGEVITYMPSLFKSITNINYRMHRKIVIIDGKIGYTGGINVGDEYLSKNKKLSPWRDTMIKIKGPAVNSIKLRFDTDYIFLNFNKNKKIEDFIKPKYLIEDRVYGKEGVQIVSSGPDSEREFIKDGYIKMINLAKKYVYIETPYFIPDESFLNAVKLAALSGIDVRIILPKMPDKIYIYFITLSYIESLLKAGVKVYLYNGFIHSKMIVIDDNVTSIGSTNIDIRSFRLNYELNAFLYGENISKRCRKIFKEDIKYSYKLDLEKFRNRNIYIKFFENVFRMFFMLA